MPHTNQNTASPPADALRLIVEGTSAATGHDFFRSLVRHLASALGFRHAMVGELLSDLPAKICTLAAWNGEGFCSNFDYALQHTPCENVVGRAACCYPERVTDLFPKDTLLRDRGVESYLGVPLMSAAGAPLGILKVMHDAPMRETSLPMSILHIFASRASAEIERLRREETQRTMERRFRAIAENSPAGIFYLSAEGECVYVNPRCSEMVGVPPAEAMGKGWSRYLHPEDRARVLDAQREAYPSHKTFRSEHRFLHPDGRIVWCLTQVVPEYQGEKVVGFVGTTTEITERKQMEDALRASEARLRILVDQVPAILWTTDETLRITSVQGAALAVMGVKPNANVGRSMYEYLGYPDPSFPPLVAMGQALSGEQASYAMEWQGRAFQCHVEPLRAPDGRVLGTIGVAIDFTERQRAEQALQQANEQLGASVAARTAELSETNKILRREVIAHTNAEEALRQSQQRFAGILNTQSTLIARADLNHRLTYINDAYSRAFGLKVGDSFTAVIHPDDVEKTKRQIAKLREPPHVCEMEERCLINGEWRWIYWQDSVIRDRAGQIVETQGVGFDVTERKRAEAALRQSEEHFRELAESNKRLLMEVDHRVRNNLAGLLSLVSLMRQNTQDVHRFAEAMEARLHAMAHIHQLLAEGGWRPVELRKLVISLLDTLANLACEAVNVELEGVPISLAPQQTLPLAMILLEWFTNSCKYGAHSVPGGCLRIRWEMAETRTGERQRQIRFRWTESGGPPIERPVKPSLGTELVHGFATRELGGRCEMHFERSGVDHIIEFPAR